MINGYCAEKEVFNLMGYTDKNIYEKSTIPFSVFVDAMYLDSLSWLDFIKVDNSYAFKFDIEQMKTHLVDYLYSNNTYNQYRHDYCSFGTTAIADFANDLVSNLELLDLRYLRTLYEHKTCMHLRIKYLYDNCFLHGGSFDNGYMEVVKKYEMIFALSMKAVMQLNQENLLKIKDYIVTSIDTEKQILENILVGLG